MQGIALDNGIVEQSFGDEMHFLFTQTLIEDIPAASLYILNCSDPKHGCACEDAFCQSIGHARVEEDIYDMSVAVYYMLLS